ncbi:DUF4405 domain-containing protein [Anaeroselena agilis]|uniref:DUF4405 domain-containing protein n=1 Tax=Anaeroselena agilis TaxID=3063788 RepID=A0ABU3P3R0_9FIRM|nr:DUF4405 domain-containing protein [Selenomonadales bacterium 4137-cl]
MAVRRVVSLLLMLVFVGVAASGVMIHHYEHRDFDYMANPGGLEPPQQAVGFLLRRGHEIAGYLMIILAFGHLLVNRRTALAHFGLTGKGGTGRCR